MPLLTVRAYVVSVYVAVRLTACAGIVTVVLAELESAKTTVSPVHAAKVFPPTAAAAIACTCPLVYEPPPVPLLTVSR